MCLEWNGVDPESSKQHPEQTFVEMTEGQGVWRTDFKLEYLFDDTPVDFSLIQICNLCVCVYV